MVLWGRRGRMCEGSFDYLERRKRSLPHAVSIIAFLLLRIFTHSFRSLTVYYYFEFSTRTGILSRSCAYFLLTVMYSTIPHCKLTGVRTRMKQ